MIDEFNQPAIGYIAQTQIAPRDITNNVNALEPGAATVLTNSTSVVKPEKLVETRVMNEMVLGLALKLRVVSKRREKIRHTEVLFYTFDDSDGVIESFRNFRPVMVNYLDLVDAQRAVREDIFRAPTP